MDTDRKKKWQIWFVQGEVIVELKCVDRFSNEHLAQCIMVGSAPGLQVLLLVVHHGGIHRFTLRISAL